MARGRIIKAGNMNTDTLTFPVLPKMGPEFKLLVYYVKESGEVVSDSRVFKVDKCFPNTVGRRRFGQNIFCIAFSNPCSPFLMDKFHVVGFLAGN